MGGASISPELFAMTNGSTPQDDGFRDGLTGMRIYCPIYPVRRVSPFAGLEAFGFMAPALFMYLMTR